MIIKPIARARRKGTTTVELAAVMIIFSMMMFGILEYCLIVYSTVVVENAAREGARYAVVNANDSTIVSDTQTYVKSLMGGLNVTEAPYSCDVYLANSSGTNIGSAAGAPFGASICVDVSLTYKPVTPGLLYLKTFTIRSKSSMMSEAN